MASVPIHTKDIQNVSSITKKSMT